MIQCYERLISGSSEMAGYLPEKGELTALGLINSGKIDPFLKKPPKRSSQKWEGFLGEKAKEKKIRELYDFSFLNNSTKNFNQYHCTEVHDPRNPKIQPC